MQLVLLSSDLMLASRVEGAARQLGLTMVSSPDAARALASLADPACLVAVVDLRQRELDIAAWVADATHSGQRPPIVACAPHVHESRLAAAREAGCEAVVTRGQLDRDAESILRGLLQL